jgi:hypothetical protein
MQGKFFHVSFKNNKGFQEAFKCETTEVEKEKYAEYLIEFYKLKKIYY